MKQFVLGIVLGSVLTGVMVEAKSLYGKDGQVQAPRGSIQQQNYFRERQLWLDVGHMRKQMDNQRLGNPCAK